MILMLTLRKEYHYEIEVAARMSNGKVVYVPQLIDAMLSHFDHHASYEGATIEEAIEKIALGIEKALVMLHEM